MGERNRYGLRRSIPSRIKRLVRQDCGFACVMCGSLGMHYDHFAPEFAHCRKHTATGIALLCPTCHQDKTAGRLSGEKVALARARAKNRWGDPRWRSQFSGKTVRLRIGTNLLIGPSVGLAFGSLALLEIHAGRDRLESWTLSGTLTHGAGTVARFDRNDIIACSGNWDVELAGTHLAFRTAPGQVVLMLSLEPDELAIERLDLRWPSGFSLYVEASGDITLDNLRHTGSGNSGNNWVLRDNRIVAAGSTGKSRFHLLGSGMATNTILSDLELSGNVVVHRGGLADLQTLVDVAQFLSADMLET